MPSGPKNQKYFNRHAAEANERKESQQSEAQRQAQQRDEDAHWEDSDKHAKRKAQRSADADAKRDDALKRKEEREELLASEEKELTKLPTKVTKRQEQKDVAALIKKVNEEQARMRPTTDRPLPGENPNKANAKAQKPEEVNASGLNDAVDQLGGKKKKGGGGGAIDGSATIPENRHIGKRARAAYKHFESENWSIIKEERPGLRRTQYNDILWEMWQKSPQNPFVQRASARAEEMQDLKKKWQEGPSDDDDDDEDDDEEDQK